MIFSNTDFEDFLLFCFVCVSIVVCTHLNAPEMEDFKNTNGKNFKANWQDMNWTHFKFKCFGSFLYVLCIPKSFTMVLFSVHFPSNGKIVLLQFYFPVFITHNTLNHLILPENFSCFSDLYCLKFPVLTSQFMPQPVLWHLISLTVFLATPTHCHSFSYYFRPLDLLSDRYLSSWRLS